MVNINWEYPPPRKGLAGALDKFIGPGATPAELWLQIAAAVLAGLAAPAYAVLKGLDWSIWQLTVAGLFAADLTGGIVTNATSAAKRWYHRAGQGALQHFVFAAAHIGHVFVVAWLFRALDWVFFGVASSYLLIASLIILGAPQYLRRPIAFLLYAVSLLVSLYALSPTPGLEWFLPFFYLKLLLSHLLREEPYRPSRES